MEKPTSIHLENYQLSPPNREEIPVVDVTDSKQTWNEIFGDRGFLRIVEKGSEKLTFKEGSDGGRVLSVNSPEAIVANAYEHPGNIVVQAGFDLEHELHPLELPGPIVEYGGPTPDGYRLIRRLGTMPESLFVANVTPEAIAEQMGSTAMKGVILSSADQMAQRDASVGAIMYSGLPGRRHIKDETLTSEIDRVLAPGGLLVAQSTNVGRTQQMLDKGFELRAMQISDWQEHPSATRIASGFDEVGLNVVMQKPLIPSNG